MPGRHACNCQLPDCSSAAATIVSEVAGVSFFTESGQPASLHMQIHTGRAAYCLTVPHLEKSSGEMARGAKGKEGDIRPGQARGREK